MTMIERARGRAEELLHNLQKKARDVLAAEERLVQTVRSILDEKGSSASDVHKLEELLGRLGANKIWERVKAGEAVAMWQGYREEVGRRVESSRQRFARAFSLVSQRELQSLSSQLAELNKKMIELSNKIEEQN